MTDKSNAREKYGHEFRRGPKSRIIVQTRHMAVQYGVKGISRRKCGKFMKRFRDE
jgi:hypothetical protein